MAARKRAKSVVAESTYATSPEIFTAKTKPPLPQKSCASLLDAATPLEASNATTPEVLPKLRRSSLQAVEAGGTDAIPAIDDKSEKRRHSEAKQQSSKRARPQRRATGFSTPTSSAGPALPQLNAGSSPPKLQSPSYSSNQLPGAQRKRSKRAGDIELGRPATIDVVVKYQRTSPSFEFCVSLGDAAAVSHVSCV